MVWTVTGVTRKQSGTFSSTKRLVWINSLTGKLSYAWPATFSARRVHSDDAGRQLGDKEWTWHLGNLGVVQEWHNIGKNEEAPRKVQAAVKEEGGVLAFGEVKGGDMNFKEFREVL